MPNALAVGVPYDVFWHLNPKKLKPFQDAYFIKRKMLDEEMWYMGQYVAMVLDSTVCNNSLWKGKNGKASKYAKKPLMADWEIGKKELSEEEKQRAVDLFFATEKARGVNWRRNHKDSKVS